MTQSTNLKHLGHLGAGAGWQHAWSQTCLQPSILSMPVSRINAQRELELWERHNPPSYTLPYTNTFQLPELEECLYLRALNVVFFLLSLLHPWLFPAFSWAFSNHSILQQELLQPNCTLCKKSFSFLFLGYAPTVFIWYLLCGKRQFSSFSSYLVFHYSADWQPQLAHFQQPEESCPALPFSPLHLLLCYHLFKVEGPKWHNFWAGSAMRFCYDMIFCSRFVCFSPLS